jgi:membrane protein implicated in regulation of membrane protease activity
VRRFLRENALSLFFGTLFLVALFAQSLAGQRAFNEEQAAHGAATYDYGRYVLSSNFGQAMLENWQSEWLQFALFALATVWFVQKGSNESKEEGKEGLESDEEQKVGEHARPSSPSWAKLGPGVRRRLYEHSLVLVMLSLFFASWLGQSVTGWNEYNDEQQLHDQPQIAWSSYLVRADFWEQTLQNWQSEFLAVGTMAVLTIYLRERGSPESKPVGSPHSETASSG